MTALCSRKVFWVALAGAGGLALLLLLLLLTKARSGTLDLHIAGQPQMTNGAMLISIVLSNGTSGSLNIVDDGAGNPFVVLDAGPASNAPGTIGLGLRNLANTLKLNLAPGTALTNTVQVTNPPPRFRLLVEARDLSSERRRAVVELLRRLAEQARLGKPTPHSLILLPASSWIVDGKISSMTQTGAENTRETLTNESIHTRKTFSTMDIPRIFNITESAHRIHNPITPEKLAILGAALRLESGARVLDLGSGSREMLCTWHAITASSAPAST